MYFGNYVTTISTILLVIACGYIACTIRKRNDIEYWGRRIAFLASFGLLICCFVAARDNYHLSVQASFDTSVNPGIFTIYSVQSTICCIGGAIIAFVSLSSIFIKKQKYRKVMFWLLSAVMIMKTLVIEISRWMI